MTLFTIALGLSKQPNGYELTHYFVEELRELLGAADCHVFEIYGINNLSSQRTLDLEDVTIRRFDHQVCNNRNSFNDEDLNLYTEAIRSQLPVVKHSDSSGLDQLVVPTTSRRGPLRLVEIKGITDKPELRVMVLQIIELYSNQIALHDSHERDKLTGLLNRYSFSDYYERIFKTVTANSHLGLTLAMLDIDHFKRVNDTYGHLFGDEVLLHFAQVMERNFRYGDFLFRYGGEEFIVLLPCNGECAIDAILERFRQAVENHQFPGVGSLTVSAGLAHCASDLLPSTVIDRADKALYYAKQHGRNRIVKYRDIQDEMEADSTGEINLF